MFHKNTSQASGSITNARGECTASQEVDHDIHNAVDSRGYWKASLNERRSATTCCPLAASIPSSRRSWKKSTCYGQNGNPDGQSAGIQRHCACPRPRSHHCLPASGGICAEQLCRRLLSFGRRWSTTACKSSNGTDWPR